MVFNIFLFLIGNSSHIHGLEDYWSRCRWGTLSGEPLLYVKYCKKLLNIVDTEKKTLTLKDPVELEKLSIKLCYFSHILINLVNQDIITECFSRLLIDAYLFANNFLLNSI